MLPARHRMRRGADFTQAVRQGRRAGRPALVVHLAAGDDPVAPALVGLVVPRAVGGAVVRNRTKRRLRALLRARVDALPPGSRLVVRANAPAGALPAAALSADLDRALGRLLPAPVAPARRVTS